MAVKKYLSLVKFSHTIFALPFALIGFFLGMNKFFSSEAEWHGVNPFTPQNTTFISVDKLLAEKFLLVLVCMVTARSAAMAFNRYLDRSFDAKKSTYRHSRNSRRYHFCQ